MAYAIRRRTVAGLPAHELKIGLRLFILERLRETPGLTGTKRLRSRPMLRIRLRKRISN
ncbi:hypothetical protein [Methylocella silvestris]|uniref:hypothetical protein n=1 Tax=Methylocella silvestris TaxID=199596 RepID=UPI0015E0AB74|nr:hypothetical protein [Methylocella silvestris]